MKQRKKVAHYFDAISADIVVNHERVADANENGVFSRYHNFTFEQDKYDKGVEWYNSGLGIEDAPVELQNNRSFVNGFKRGHRLALIEELTSKNKTR